MTDKEKIRAEIERLLNAEWKWQKSIEGKYRCETYRELLQFIDSLPEEPISGGLEEAAIEYCGGNKGADARVRAGFIMGANWQKEQIIEKACEWIRPRVIFPDITIERFRKAMEEEK